MGHLNCVKPTAVTWLGKNEFVISDGRQLVFYSTRLQGQGGELNCSQVKSIPWSESDTSSIKSMTSNKTAGGAHLLLVTDKNELLSTSLRNNTTQKIKVPSSIVPEEVSFVITNRNQAILITKSSIAILDILQSKVIRKIENIFSQIRDFACTPINDKLACAVGNRSTVKLIDLTQGKIIQEIEIPNEHI